MTIPLHMLERMKVAEAQFHKNDAFTSLEVDADSLIYKIAATTKTLEAAKRRFVDEALTLHFLADADLSSLHLTPKHCTKAGRFNILAAQPYQGNRVNTKKPPLVEPLRYAVGRERLVLPPEISIVFNDVYEADDSVVMACHKDVNSIFYSEDKDLDCLINRKLCSKGSVVLPEVEGLGWVQLVQLSTKKVVGRGPSFFWAQMLMGDVADHIKGLKRAKGELCGAVKTHTLLQPFLTPTTDLFARQNFLATITEQDIARFVLGLYRESGQNFWPEGWLLWLYRTENYNLLQHIKYIGLWDDEDLGPWIKEQFKLKWFNKE